MSYVTAIFLSSLGEHVSTEDSLPVYGMEQEWIHKAIIEMIGFIPAIL